MFPFSAHSPQTHAIAGLFRDVFALAVVIFLCVACTVMFGVFRYRSRGEEEPPQVEGSRRLEVIWTAVPLFIVLVMFVVTVRTMASVDAPDDRRHVPDLFITGHQWWWEVRYPNGMVTAGEIHIPVGRRLLARIDTADVIHDFWVPELARKIDAVPGLPGNIWLEADTPGDYPGSCAEFCGVQHAWMRFVVVAEPEQAFSAWLRHESEPAAVPSAGPEAIGARLFEQKNCGSCHAISGTSSAGRSGPDLSHIADRQYLGSGISRNTPEKLAQWIADPQAAKPGNRMPASPLSAVEAQELQAYLESLK
jgi:cytochrome c oxidase subunit 2